MDIGSRNMYMAMLSSLPEWQESANSAKTKSQGDFRDFARPNIVGLQTLKIRLSKLGLTCDVHSARTDFEFQILDCMSIVMDGTSPRL